MNDTIQPEHTTTGLEIAITGMAFRLPGASSVEQFWHNLCAGVESIASFTDEELLASGLDPRLINDPRYVKASGIVEDIELFDAAFFGFNAREAEIMDPQQRLFLECAWEALENAGYDSTTYQGSIGVYAGAGMNTYLLNNLCSNRDFLAAVGGIQAMLGNEKDYLTTRVSYKLDLRGPGVTVQTACSTSLVAIHLACQSLLLGESDMVLAGGVSIGVPQKAGYLYREGSIFSPDGHCRAFDAQAQGTVSGSGAGIVVLKRLEDALAAGDCIHAVIKGSAMNNDGAAKIGYTAPGIKGQTQVIRAALMTAEVEPESITYVETHGTGTVMGDPIEIAALTQAFETTTGAKGFCALGSVKTNIGHLDTVAGVAGLIKTVLALKHRMLPPSLHFTAPNPEIDFANSPFYVQTTLSEWKRNEGPLRAGVSSFGFGGTNAHIILEEAPLIEASQSSRPWHLLLLSARTMTALETASMHLETYVQQHPELPLADIAYTLQVGRKAFDYRRMLLCRDHEEAVYLLETHDPQRVFTHVREHGERTVVFLFPGQGTQYVHMMADLYQNEPTFQQQVDRCADLLRPYLKRDLREVLYPSAERVDEAEQLLQQTELAQPALFVVEYALAQLWQEWGIQPQAMLGHSLGEYVAACLANVFSLEEGLALVATRGKLMQALPAGAMLSIAAPSQTVTSLLSSELSLAAINSQALCVVSGPLAAIMNLQNQLTGQGISSHRLQTSHAFHSAMLDPMLEAFLSAVSKIELKPPTLPFLSNLTGTWITNSEATDPHYWVSQLRQPVRFADGVHELRAESARILLEVGPGQVLSTLVRSEQTAEVLALPSLPRPKDGGSEQFSLQTTLGRLWLAGVQVDWRGLHSQEQLHRVPLPTYPFERQRYWVEPQTPVLQSRSYPSEVPEKAVEAGTHQEKGSTLTLHTRPPLLTAYVAPENEIEESIVGIWQELLGVEPIGTHDDYLELGGHSLLATQIIARLRDTFQVELSLTSFFEAATIAELAGTIEELLIEKVEALSEDEIQRFF